MQVNRILTLIAVLFLAACAQDKIILLPQQDGSSSAVTVKAKTGKQVLLDKPFSTAETSRNPLTKLLGLQNDPSLSVSDAKEVEKRYKNLADALPMRPKTYIVYFHSGENRLTAESEGMLNGIVEAINATAAPELVVTGYTDSVGSVSANDKISLARATLIRDILIQRGIPSRRIETLGRGKRQLLVPTADGVDEPRNRRVEIRLK